MTVKVTHAASKHLIHICNDMQDVRQVPTEEHMCLQRNIGVSDSCHGDDQHQLLLPNFIRHSGLG